MCKKVCNFAAIFAEIRKIIVNKALLTKKTVKIYEENASYRSCSIRCYELRQQVLRQKVLPGHLLPSGHRRGS
jgi:hypothetical protein